MFKKVISLAVALIMCSAFVGVFADGVFSDVTEENYSWAVNEIEEMASMGIIKGYSEDTFAPADNVTKMQALLLCSRIVGFSDENNILFVEKASEIYEEALESYEIDYKAEVAYLLYKGILTTKELHAYIADENASLPLKRYEAAVLMTKVMGAEEEAEVYTGSSVFTDSADIPATAKPYVNYVYSIGLMLGMNKTDEVNEFAPMVDVNRAQMAVLLYRMMEIMNSETEFGIVESVNAAGGTIMFKSDSGKTSGISLGARDNVKIYVDGYAAEVDSIQPQSVLAVTKRDGVIYSVEAITVWGDEQFEGIVVSVVSSSVSGGSIKVRAVGDKEEITYNLSEDVSVTVEGAPSSMKSVKAGMHIFLEIKDGEVILADAYKKDKSVVGTVSEILLTPNTGLTITTTAGDKEDYFFADEVTVTRNGKSCEASEILVGDKVTISLLYNQISKVTAASTNFSATGVIDKILISSLPQITVISNGAEQTYSISREATFTVDGVIATIYDLRLGANVNLSVQGETVTKVTSTAPATSAVITGTIEVVNAAYGFMLISTTDANSEAVQTQVFLKNSSLTIINSATGKSMLKTALKPGMSVSVTGVVNTGAFEATTVIVLP